MANEKYMQAAKARKNKRKKSTMNFPDLNKDGKITYADVLMGRGIKGK